MDALSLDRGEILDRSVLGVTSDLLWTQFPTDAGTPKEIKGRLVLLHFGWRN